MEKRALTNLTPAVVDSVPDTEDVQPLQTFEDHLSHCVAAFEESEDMTREARDSSELCRDYYNGQQYTAAELATMRRRGQAPVWDNHIRRKVDSICGLERRTRTDPKAFPRNPQDEKTAEAVTDALRFVADQNRFPAVKSDAFGDILIEGTGAVQVVVAQDGRGDVNILTKRIPWDRFFFDPHSRLLDFEDASYMGIVIWDNADNVLRDYPGRADAVESTLTYGAQGQTYDDRPKYTWCDSKRKRVRIVQIEYFYDGEWWVATFTRGGFLVDPVVSPYKDKEGNSTRSIIARSGYIDRENRRYGHCKDLIPLQDEINKRRSKALHLMSQRQTYGNKRAIQDVKKAKTELAKPDGHVEINEAAQFGADFGVLPTGDMVQGQVLMLNQALESMNATGANAAVQGKDERQQSGVALQTRIQAGATELEPQIDGLREMTHQIMERIWMCVRQFWTAEKWVRVTDDDRNMKWVGLNKQITVQERLSQLPPDQQEQVAQQMQLQPNDPRLQMVVAVENEVSGLDVDVVIEEGPDIAALQSEQFGMLVDLAKAGMPIPPTAIIKASSLRNKDQLLDEIEKAQEQQAQQQAQMQQQAQQLSAATAETKIENTQADTQKKLADARATEIDSELKGMQAIAPVGLIQ